MTHNEAMGRGTILERRDNTYINEPVFFGRLPGSVITVETTPSTDQAETINVPGQHADRAAVHLRPEVFQEVLAA